MGASQRAPRQAPPANRSTTRFFNRRDRLLQLHAATRIPTASRSIAWFQNASKLRPSGQIEIRWEAQTIVHNFLQSHRPDRDFFLSSTPIRGNSPSAKRLASARIFFRLPIHAPSGQARKLVTFHQTQEQIALSTIDG